MALTLIQQQQQHGNPLIVLTSLEKRLTIIELRIPMQLRGAKYVTYKVYQGFGLDLGESTVSVTASDPHGCKSLISTSIYIVDNEIGLNINLCIVNILSFWDRFFTNIFLCVGSFI